MHLLSLTAMTSKRQTAWMSDELAFGKHQRCLSYRSEVCIRQAAPLPQDRFPETALREYSALYQPASFDAIEVSAIMANTSTKPRPSQRVNGEPIRSVLMSAAVIGSLKPNRIARSAPIRRTPVI